MRAVVARVINLRGGEGLFTSAQSFAAVIFHKNIKDLTLLWSLTKGKTSLLLSFRSISHLFTGSAHAVIDKNPCKSGEPANLLVYLKINQVTPPPPRPPFFSLAPPCRCLAAASPLPHRNDSRHRAVPSEKPSGGMHETSLPAF